MSTNAEPRPGAEMKAGVRRMVGRGTDSDREAETARFELLKRLTERGVPVYPDRIRERRGTDLAGGDFVRWAKQTIDLLELHGTAGHRRGRRGRAA